MGFVRCPGHQDILAGHCCSPKSHNLRLLIVDDDRRRNDTKWCAIDAGFDVANVAQAESEPAASSLIEARWGPPDVAVVDIHLSSPPIRADGFAIMAKLREVFPSCRVVCLSASACPADGAMAIRSGACDFVSTHWPDVNWAELLAQRLKLWSGVQLQVRHAAAPREGS